MTKKELIAAKEKASRPKRRAAKKLQNAVQYLFTVKEPSDLRVKGPWIEKADLEPTVSILRLCKAGARRGWLYPEEIAKLAKLTGRKQGQNAATI